MYNVLVLRVICKLKIFSSVQLDILYTDGPLQYLPISEPPGQVINRITQEIVPPFNRSTPVRH
jgi:hypothetical protein